VVDLPTGPEPPGGGLVLVVGDRAGQFAAGTGDVDDRVSVHPEDAADNGLEDGMRVRVSTGAASVETTAQVSRSIRPGVVSLHASVADPLVRDGGHHVDVTPVD
jgi:anaerobic selenocysteine-containing dehydrogenase